MEGMGERGERGRREDEQGSESEEVVMICFFFQAEDGIRDYDVTGVQTCALPIYDVQTHGGRNTDGQHTGHYLPRARVTPADEYRSERQPTQRESLSPRFKHGRIIQDEGQGAQRIIGRVDRSVESHQGSRWQQPL